MKKLAKNRHCIFIKLDPGICIRELSPQNLDVPYKKQAQEIIMHLKALGCIHKGFTTYMKETIQPRFIWDLKNVI